MKLETFFEKFDQFADAPDAVAKMRELVLQLAVQGKLVEQKPKELSAGECVRKANKPLVNVALDDSIETPAGWVALPLGCLIAANTGGGTPSKQNPSYWNGPIPWASVKDVQSEKYLTSTIDSITEEGLKDSSSNLIPPNHLIVVTRMGLGKLAINTIPVAINQDLRAIEPTTALDLDFAYLLFKSLKMVGSGVTVKGITVDKLHAMPVLLPPLAEQKRIVAKVDELMALCDRLEAQQQERETRHAALARASLARFADAPTPANLHFLFHPSYAIPPADLRKSILTLAVQGKLVPQDPNDEPALTLLDQIAFHKAALTKEGKLRGSTTVKAMADDEAEFEIPSNWCWVRFGEIMVNRDGERIPVSKEERETKAKTYDYYGASGVIDKIDGYLFDKPLLLIGEDGANLINRSTPIAFIARGKYWVNNHAHVLDGISEDFLRFIELHINAINLEKYVTGSAQPKMNQAKMNSIPIALPPLAEQRRIVAKVEQLMALVDALEQQLAASRATAANLLTALVAELTTA